MKAPACWSVYLVNQPEPLVVEQVLETFRIDFLQVVEAERGKRVDQGILDVFVLLLDRQNNYQVVKVDSLRLFGCLLQILEALFDDRVFQVEPDGDDAFLRLARR